MKERLNGVNTVKQPKLIDAWDGLFGHCVARKAGVFSRVIDDFFFSRIMLLYRHLGEREPEGWGESKKDFYRERLFSKLPVNYVTVLVSWLIEPFECQPFSNHLVYSDRSIR